MKTGKLKGVTTIEAAGIVMHLGGKTMLYRDAPLLNIAQIIDVCNEAEANEADSILFDKGALFDPAAYELAREAVKGFEEKYPDQLKVVIYNIAE
jgi:hypothetical protein